MGKDGCISIGGVDQVVLLERLHQAVLVMDERLRKLEERDGD